MNTLNETLSSPTESEPLLKRINNVFYHIKYVKEASTYVTPEGLYQFIHQIITMVIKEELIIQILQQKQCLYDAQSAVDTSIFFDKKFDTNHLEDHEQVVFIFLILKYICYVYKRFTIFGAIYAYRDPDEFIDPRILQSPKAKEIVTRRSSTRNFIHEVILPFLGFIEFRLSNLKADLENDRVITNSIYVGGNIEGNFLLGDFSNNHGTISDTIKNPEMIILNTELYNKGNDPRTEELEEEFISEEKEKVIHE